VSPEARAYALLWTYQGTDKRIHKARKLLLQTLKNDEQHEALTWIKEEEDTGPCELCKGLGWLVPPVSVGKMQRCPNGCFDNHPGSRGWKPGR